MRKFLVILIFLLSKNVVKAQIFPFSHLINDYTVNFYTACNLIDIHFDSTNKETKGNGYKFYQRWKNLNEPNFFPTGNRNVVSPNFAYEEWIKFNRKNTKRSFLGSGWQDLGPYRVDSITHHYAAGLGRLENAFVDPKNTNKIYLASRSGGFWRSTNGGLTWKNTTPFLPASGVNIIAVSPWNSDSVLINVQNSSNEYSHGIYRSIDGGLTWTTTNFIKANVGFGGLGDNFTIYKVHYHPRIPNLIFVGTSKGLYRSTNNLSTWTIVYPNSDPTEIAFHPTNDSVVYIYDEDNSNANRDRVSVSRDFGVTYKLAGTLIGNAKNKSIEFCTSSTASKSLWVSSSNGIWVSHNEASTFTFIGKPKFSCGGFAINTADTSKICHGYDDMARSINGGRTFTQNTFWSLGNTNGAGKGHQNSFFTSTNYVHADINDMFFTAGSFYACTDGLLCKSSDNGITWKILSQGAGNREFYKIGTSQSNHYKTMGGSQDNGSSQRIKNGWVEIYGADGMEQLYHPLNEQMLILSFQYGGRQSSLNGGLNLSDIKPGGSKSAAWEAPIAYNPNNPFEIYDFRDSIYKSTNFGKSYLKIGGPKSWVGDIGHAEIATNNSNLIAITNYSNIDLSTDGGITFKSIKGTLPNNYIEDIAFDPKYDSTLIVVYGNYVNDNKKIYITYNLGVSWSNITHNLGSMPIRSVVIDHTKARNIYVGAEIGIYTKPITGNNWTLFNTNLPNTTTQELEINWGSNTLKAATWGHGLWENSLVDRNNYPAIITTNISTPPTLETPKKDTRQFVTSTINYATKPSSVFVKYAINNINCNTTIVMNNVSDSTWVSASSLPTIAENDNVYFVVYAVGTKNDTTESYRFMYTVKPFKYCEATGNKTAVNLYISEVKVDKTIKTSLNTGYSNYVSPVFTQFRDSTYNLNVKAVTNANMADNDFSAYIDFNKDGVFSTDETVLSKLNQGAIASANYTVPKTIFYGDTVKMRVKLSYTDWNLSPCGLGNLGEVEDYSVVLKFKPTTTITVDNNSICNGSMVNLAVNGDVPDFVKWEVSNGSTIYKSTGLKYALNLNAVGKFTVKAVCFFTKDSFTLTNSNLILVSPNYNLSETKYVCNGTKFTYPDGTVDSIFKDTSHISTFKSSFNCDSVIQTNVVVTFSSASANSVKVCSGSNYTFADGYTATNITKNMNYSVTTLNKSGCDSVHTVSIIVKPKSYYTQNKIQCDSFKWINGITYTNSTSLPTYTLQNSVGCDSIITLNLTINTIVVSVSKNANTLTAEPNNAQKYQWINCLSPSVLSNNNLAVYSPTISGSYACIVTKNDCIDTTFCTAVTLGLYNKLLVNGFKVFPNPSLGIIQLTNPNINEANVVVYSQLGQKVFEQKNNVPLPMQLNLTHLNKGSYYLVVFSAKGSSVIAFNKE